MRRSATAAETALGAGERKISADEFARCMAAVGPFEPSPAVAVAVSGGADSLALTLLANDWVRANGGMLTALTVDHGLRPESAVEAERVAQWLGTRAIPHHVLSWRGPYPIRGLQEAARAARYALLGDWCRRHDILHLLTAHHRDDQAETVILRLGRGSGLAGLAGMAATVEQPHYRLLRPLLHMAAGRLRETLRAAGQGWIEDPSNHNPDFARARVRSSRPMLDDLGLSVARLADTADHLGRARIALESAVESLLARAALLHPAGFVTLDPLTMRSAPAEIGLRALAAVIATIGGSAYSPRFERLDGLARALFDGSLGRGRTLGGCRIAPWRERWLIYREPAAIAPPLPLVHGRETLWDGRFLARPSPDPDLSVGALGNAGAAALRAIASTPLAHHVPRRVWPSLPALWQDDRLMAASHLGWRRPGGSTDVILRFRPAQPLCGVGFAQGRSERRGL